MVMFAVPTGEAIQSMFSYRFGQEPDGEPWACLQHTAARVEA